MNPGTSESDSIWCHAKATRAHPVIDAADYFEIIQAAMMNAKHRIMLIGWDFDTRIDLTRSRRKKGDPPKRLGDFILWLADRTPGLEIKLLKWNIGALKMLGRGQTIVDVAKWAMPAPVPNMKARAKFGRSSICFWNRSPAPRSSSTPRTSILLLPKSLTPLPSG